MTISLAAFFSRFRSKFTTMAKICKCVKAVIYNKDHKRYVPYLFLKSEKSQEKA